MKNYYLLIGLLISLSPLQGQNLRWELSGQAFSTFNTLFEQGSPNLTKVRHYGIRLGLAPNQSSDIQFGLRYQMRTDYGESILLTETRIRRAAQACEERTLEHESTGYEGELLYRIRTSQFSRLHAFFGGGIAWLFQTDLHDYDSDIEMVDVRTRNGRVQTVECGYPDGLFDGGTLALVFAPGLRFRATHKIHLELESQFRYFPGRTGNGVGGLGLNVVYNFY